LAAERFAPYSCAMWRRLFFLAALLVMVIAALALPYPAPAAQDDPRLDALFDRLRATANAAEAGVLEGVIWRIWLQSGDSAVDRLMSEGVAAMNAQAFDDALTKFDAIVAAAPQFAEGWNKRATLHYLMGDYAASVGDIRRTLELEPRHFGALSGLGLIYDALGEDAAALRTFEAALAINPHMPGIRLRTEELRKRVGGRPA
jgi:tetratricopeptide (TPR) repeat protein